MEAQGEIDKCENQVIAAAGARQRGKNIDLQPSESSAGGDLVALKIPALYIGP